MHLGRCRRDHSEWRGVLQRQACKSSFCSVSLHLIPSQCVSSGLSEDFFTRNEWDDWDKRSWADLTKEPAIIITDSPVKVREAVALQCPNMLIIVCLLG